MHSPRRCNHCNHDTHLDIVTVVTIVTHSMAHCVRHSPRHGDVDALMCTSQPIHHTRYIGSMFNANNSCMPKLYGLHTLVPAIQLTTSSAVLVTSFRPHLFRVFSSSMLVISSWPCTFVPCLAPSCLQACWTSQVGLAGLAAQCAVCITLYHKTILFPMQFTLLYLMTWKLPIERHLLLAAPSDAHLGIKKAA